MDKLGKVIALAKTIDKLRTELGRREAELKKLIGEQDEVEDQDRVAVPPCFHNGSLPARIVSVVRHMPGRLWSAPDVCSLMGVDVPVQQVRGTLKRMSDKGVMYRASRGRYRLVDGVDAIITAEEVESKLKNDYNVENAG